MNERDPVQNSEPRRAAKRGGQRRDDYGDQDDEDEIRRIEDDGPENVEADHLETPTDQRRGHRRNPSDLPADPGQQAGFRSKLRAPTTGGGLKQPTQ